MEQNRSSRTLSLVPAGALLLAASIASGAAPASPPGPRADARLSDAELSVQVNEALGLAQSSLLTLDVDAVPGQAFIATVPVNGQVYTLDLQPYSVRDPFEYQVLIDDGSGVLTPAEPGPVNTYRGTVLEEPGMTVAAGLVGGGLQAVLVPADGSGRWWLQQASTVVADADPSDYVLYHDSDLLPRDNTCGVDDAWLADKEVFVGDGDGGGENGGGGVAGGQPVDCYWFTQLACDVDNIYYVNNGSSIPFIEAKINDIINLANVQYENQVIIHHVITTIIVRTTPVYSSTTNMSVLLNEFRNRWVTFHSGVVRDLAQLFTGRDASGSVIGQAWTIGSICSNSTSYCVVEDITGLPDRADLSAHEMGHLWGADHCTCEGYTMAAVQTVAALQFHPTFTVPEITSYRITRQSVCLTNDCIAINNECENAIAVTAGTTFFDTDNSTTDGPSDQLCSVDGSAQVTNDIWFEYQAPCDGDVTIDLCGSNFDTRVAVYPNACPSFSNSAIACDDDSSCGNTSIVTFPVTDNSTYIIRVGGFDGATGTGQMEIIEPVCVPAPSNDNCGSAASLSTGTTPFSTIGATTDGPDEAGGPCDVGGSSQITNDIWYRFVSSCEETVTISLCNADYDTRLAVYSSACPVDPGTAIACNDDACGLQSEVSFSTGPGTYRVRVGGFDGATGSGDLVVTCGPVMTPCTGDTNDDGFVNVDDLNNVILDWGTDGSANGGDITGQAPGSGPDGAVDVNDLNAVIVNWGVCP